MSHTVVSISLFLSVNGLSLGEAALTYARMGLAVLPLRSREKDPLIRRGCHDATTNLAQIRAWWTQWPQANIGIAVGEANGWMILDVDPRHRGLTSLEAMERHARGYGNEVISATLTQMSGGGGLHLVYQWPGWDREPSLVAFTHTYPGIDLKKKGYIVAAPSIHPHGLAYRWLRGTHPAPFPAMLDLFLEHSQLAGTRVNRPTPIL